ncbi:TIGR02757 family protein [Bacteroidales bacterium 6E]|nr:TIGR02757 family protein [Bacteroidales bacterium 6E]
MNNQELKEFLEEKTDLYNRPHFIETDPIQVPKAFSGKENIEIAGFLTATIAWGNRTSIIRNAHRLLHLLDHHPYEFITTASERELFVASEFVHRTFNQPDTLYFLQSLRNLYLKKGGLEKAFLKGFKEDMTVYSSLREFRNLFFELPGQARTRKHISDVTSGSAAKRLNMYLRWMCRNDNRGVDIGIWKGIPTSSLMLPLDVHTGNVARKLGILTRKQNDWKAVEEVMSVLRNFDAADPVKYDFALFGLGAFEKF